MSITILILFNVQFTWLNLNCFTKMNSEVLLLLYFTFRSIFFFPNWTFMCLFPQCVIWSVCLGYPFEWISCRTRNTDINLFFFLILMRFRKKVLWALFFLKADKLSWLLLVSIASRCLLVTLSAQNLLGLPYFCMKYGTNMIMTLPIWIIFRYL